MPRQTKDRRQCAPSRRSGSRSRYWLAASTSKNPKPPEGHIYENAEPYGTRASTTLFLADANAQFAAYCKANRARASPADRSRSRPMPCAWRTRFAISTSVLASCGSDGPLCLWSPTASPSWSRMPLAGNRRLQQPTAPTAAYFKPCPFLNALTISPWASLTSHLPALMKSLSGSGTPFTGLGGVFGPATAHA